MAPTRAQKLKQLKTKLRELEEVKLRDALTKYGEAYQDSGGAWAENAAWELADEEISVLRAMIVEVKKEIKELESYPSVASSTNPARGGSSSGRIKNPK